MRSTRALVGAVQGGATKPTLYPREVPEVSDHTTKVDGRAIFWRSAPSPAGVAPSLYVHGVPSNSDDWLPFLAQPGGIAPDLPGFGRSAKPDYLKYTIEEYVLFLEAFLDQLEIEQVRLV